MLTQLLRELGHAGEGWIHECRFAVIESGHADIARNAKPRLAQCFIHTSRNLIRAGKYRSHAFAPGKNATHSQIAELVVVGMNFTDPRLQAGLKHALAVTF